MITLVVEIEFEAKAQHPFPLFLIVLVRKYRQETMLENFIEWSKGEDPVPSIAEFSLFLGRFILSKTTMAGEEIECMMELLHVL
jgi:hypothetical protein